MNNLLPNKKQQSKPIVTIDEKHTEMLNYFNDIETTIIPQLVQEIAELKVNLRELDRSLIEQIMDLKDQIMAKKSKIKMLQSQKNGISWTIQNIFLIILSKKNKYL